MLFKFVENLTNRKAPPICTHENIIKAFQTDYSSVNNSLRFAKHRQSYGTDHPRTLFLKLQQNVSVERLNRTKVDLVRSMLKNNQVEKCFWSNALSITKYAGNRDISKSLLQILRLSNYGSGISLM